MNYRFIKILFGTCISIYMTIVCFNNITDYNSNFQFVRMVTGMEDVFAKEKTGWRAISNNTLHHITYVFIIGFELIIAMLSMAGVFKMWKELKSGAEKFNQSKKLIITAVSLGVLLWFGLFITLAGEWFLMWQSKDWNGQQTAFSLSICFLLFLIFLNQQDE